MSGPLRVSVVGHVNTGKTSLIATLARRDDLAIGDGRTTFDVQEVSFSRHGEELLVLVDTPGFEMISEITDELELDKQRSGRDGRRDDLEILEAFVARARAAARRDLELDLRALQAALGADVIFYVVDVTQEPLERLRDEVALLVRTARPVVGVLNFTAEAHTYRKSWEEVFRREKVHALVAFDVMIKDQAAERELFRTMLTVVSPERRPQVERLEAAQLAEGLGNRLAAIRAAAALLLDLMTLEVSVPRSEPDAVVRARAALERAAREREREGLVAVGRAHGFAGDEVRSRGSDAAAEIVEESLFDPEALRRHGPGLMALAASGAALGGTIDLMVGGASLLAGALLGGVAGVVGGLVRRAVQVQRRGEAVHARLDPALAWVVLGRAVACHDAYRARTHARRDVVDLEDGALPPRERPDAGRVVALLRKVRRDPELTDPARRSPRRRAEVLALLEGELGGLLR